MSTLFESDFLAEGSQLLLQFYQLGVPRMALAIETWGGLFFTRWIECHLQDCKWLDNHASLSTTVLTV